MRSGHFCSLGSCCQPLRSFPSPHGAAPAHSLTPPASLLRSPLTPSNLYPGYPQKSGAALPSTAEFCGESKWPEAAAPATEGKDGTAGPSGGVALQPAPTAAPERATGCLPGYFRLMQMGWQGTGRPWGCAGRGGLQQGKAPTTRTVLLGGLLPGDTVTPCPSSPEDSCTQTSHHGQLCPNQSPSHLPLVAILPTFPPVLSQVRCCADQHHHHGALVKTRKGEGEMLLPAGFYHTS